MNKFLVSGVIKPGTLMAIMGASGAGKIYLTFTTNLYNLINKKLEI